MQTARGTHERKAKLARSYQELLDDFGNADLKSVGNYQLGRLIGKGSFGKVYLATHKLTNGSKVGYPDGPRGDGWVGVYVGNEYMALLLTPRAAGRAQVRQEG